MKVTKPYKKATKMTYHDGKTVSVADIYLPMHKISKLMSFK